MIYLDNNSTTKPDPRVVDYMMPFIKDFYGNASSNHDFGVKSSEAIKIAREKVAELIGASENEIYFTSGATESINLALKGIIESSIIKSPHIITCVTEHPAILDTCRYLETKGVSITYIPVSEFGLIDIKNIKSAIGKNTVLISIMLVNNETGVIQPLKEISKIAHENDILFMSDATQAVGKIGIDVYDLGIDILCFSGHKFYSTKGVGGLFLRSKKPHKVKLPSLLHGGGHEKGLRSGTLNVPGIVGIGQAALICIKERKKDEERIGKLRDKLESSLLKISDSFLNGDKTFRIYTTSNICFTGADADAIIVGLKNIAVSNGSACSSTSIEPSHVLKAMGKTNEQAFSSIRFSLGRFTSEIEIEETIKNVTKVVAHLREMVK